MTFQILVVDDDTTFVRLLEIRLKSFLSDVAIVRFPDLQTAREFLKLPGAHKFDLVIMDEHLPDGRGVELIGEGWFHGLAVLSVSSDNAPEIPGATLKAGATFFLNKEHISQPLFQPLVRGIIDRNKLQRELEKVKLDEAVIDTVKTLVATLRHEVNNPLGAVLGAAYLLQANKSSTEEQKEAARLVEASGHRIKHVLDQLCDAVHLSPVTKAKQKVFHIPGDAPWEGNEEEKK